MKTTQKHFVLFKAEAQKWIDYFGLKSWQVYFRHVKLSTDIGGQCSWKYSGKNAIISLNTVLGKEYFEGYTVDQTIKRIAFHEVCELLLAPLMSLAQARYDVMELEINARCHEVVRTLENTVWFNSK